MYSTDHDLCRLEHLYSNANLKIISRCSIRLSSDRPFASSSNSSGDFFENLAAAGAWVTGGNCVQLRICTLGHQIATEHIHDPATTELQAMVIKHLKVLYLPRSTFNID